MDSEAGDQEDGEISNLDSKTSELNLEEVSLDKILKKNSKVLLPSKMIKLEDSNVLFKYDDKRIENLAYIALANSDKISNISRVYDERMSSDSTWIGIILRKVPDTPNIRSDIIKSFNNSTVNTRDLIKNDDIMSPVVIQDKYCTQITINGRIE